MKQRMTKLQADMDREKATIHSLAAHCTSHESAFQLLKEYTKIDDINEIVERFIDQENDIFSYFNYVKV